MTRPVVREVLSFGGGTQSWAVLCAVARGLITPKPDVVLFADTGYEKPEVLEYMAKHMPAVAAAAGVEFMTCRRSETTLAPTTGGGFYFETGNHLPHTPMTARYANGRITRLPKYCTHQWKTSVIRHVLYKKFGQQHRRVEWICFSLDEAWRAQKPAFAGSPNRQYRFPLFELRWTRHDSIRFVEDFGLPTPPRSACFFCPFQRDDEWGTLAPETKEKVIKIERKINRVARAAGDEFEAEELTFHQSGVSFDKVELKGEGQPRLFCDTGNCFT